MLLTILAPAKINRFLHIIDRRSDGFHLLETIFQMINLYDEIEIESRSDGAIKRVNSIENIPEYSDIMIKSARFLQNYTNTSYGCNIYIKKRIPVGAGLGGGSSDAAAILIGLNKIWNTKLPKKILMQIGLNIGADVPFFIFGKNAFASGIGEQLKEVKLKKSNFLIIYPNIQIHTKEIFSDKNLPKNFTKCKISKLLECISIPNFGKNDCEKTAIQKYPEISQVIDWIKSLLPHAYPRMSGSGSSIFAEIPIYDSERLLQKIPNKWIGFICQSINFHPLL